jgi:hypothetical protein
MAKDYGFDYSNKVKYKVDIADPKLRSQLIQEAYDKEYSTLRLRIPEIPIEKKPVLTLTYGSGKGIENYLVIEAYKLLSKLDESYEDYVNQFLELMDNSTSLPKLHCERQQLEIVHAFIEIHYSHVEDLTKSIEEQLKQTACSNNILSTSA